MPEETIESLSAKLNALREQQKTDKLNEQVRIAQDQNSIKKLQEEINSYKEIISKRIHLTQQRFQDVQSNDPSLGMPLTQEQKGIWEGRIETWEYALLIAREVFE